MKKILLASAMFAMMTGGAFAQTINDTTTITRSATPSGGHQVDVTNTTKAYDGNGNAASETTKSYSRSTSPADDSVKVKRSEKVIDSEGNQSSNTRTYSREGDSTSVTTTNHTTNADGTEQTTHVIQRKTPE